MYACMYACMHACMYVCVLCMYAMYVCMYVCYVCMFIYSGRHLTYVNVCQIQAGHTCSLITIEFVVSVSIQLGHYTCNQSSIPGSPVARQKSEHAQLEGSDQ